MRLATIPLPRHFRVFAAMMLWVWLVSQSFCVAHCHGVLGKGLSQGSTLTGAAKISHGCCARSKPAQQTGSDVALHGASDGVSSSRSASQNQESQFPTQPCSPQAVIPGALNLENPTWSPVGLPFPPSDADVGSCGDFSISRQLRTAAGQPRLSDQAVPRWDAGFEPAVVLGSGLRSLAPPIGV
jgi:hypothetical protein